jgi:hypothetical protein
MEEKRDPGPDTISYNTFLGYYQQHRDLRKLASMVNQMTAAKIQGDVFTFSTILAALLKEGRDDAPDMLLGLMQKQGVQANAVVYTSIIKRLLTIGDDASMKGAMEMLQRMEQDPNVQPTEVTYHTFLSGISRASTLPWDRAEVGRKYILQRMKRRGIALTARTYNILLRSSFASNQPDAVQSALSYYREMVKQDVPRVQSTWYILLSGLLEKGEVVLASELVRTMTASRVELGESITQLVKRIREAMSRTHPKQYK